MNHPPEVELILCSARTHIDGPTAQCMADLLQGELDWSFLMRAGLRHRLVPLLHQNLSQITSQGIAGVSCDSGCIPADIRRSMQEHYALTLQRNLYLTGQLFSILERFKEQDIFVLPYKGPVQASFLYGNLSSRQFMDLDILVAPDEAERALQVLHEQGYKVPGHWGTDHENLFLQLAQIHECALHNPATGVTIELHWRLEGLQFARETNNLTYEGRLNTTLFQGREVKIFAPNDLLLLLASHGVRHLWFRLHWLNDLAQLVQTQQLDWNEIVKRARATGKLRGLVLSLVLCNQMLGAELPLPIRDLAENDSAIQELVEQLQLYLFQEDTEVAKVERRLLQMLNQDALARGGPAVCTSVALVLGNQLMGAPLPREIADQKDSHFRNSVAKLRAWLTRTIDTPSSRYNRFQLQIRERAVDKIRYIWWTWCAPGDKELRVLRISPRLRLLRFPIRVGRLAIKYGTGLAIFKRIYTVKPDHE